MKTVNYTTMSILTIFLTLSFYACGEIKVKGDVGKDTIDAINDAFDNSDSTDSSTATDSSGTSTDTTSNDTTSSNNTSTDSTSTTGDPNDASGGLQYWSATQKGTDRFFMGTWQESYSYNACSDDYYGAGLEMPAILRGYSHGDYIDWETSLSQLVWSAIVYEDNTFDFQVRYLDALGKPSITLTCTCVITEYNSDYSWQKDTLECTCDPSNDTQSCEVNYEKM